MHYLRPAAVGLAVTLLTLAPAMAGGQKSAKHAAKTAETSPLNRVAFAVDGAESSHGADAAMWRPDPAGPEGPMQVSAAAASDVGGGDRFDLDQNRALGRAYLAALYRRYRNWPDAIAAYNWGIGHLNAWVKAGRPPDRVAAGVVAYLQRVMRDSGLCPAPSPIDRRRTEPAGPGCEDLRDWPVGQLAAGSSPSAFETQLNRGLQLAMQHAGSFR
jgi:hypothetical protein